MMDTDTRNRLNAELCELSQRISKLELFLNTAKSKLLPELEQFDLSQQLKHMRRYQDVLVRRYDRAMEVVERQHSRMS